MVFEFKSEPRRTSISLTPLIDVVFILLLFFMLATRFEVWQADNVSTTAVATVGSAADTRQAIVITVAADSSLSLEGTILTTAQLEKELLRVKETASDSLITLHADTGTSIQQLYDVIGLIKTSGLRRLQLTSAEHAG